MTAAAPILEERGLYVAMRDGVRLLTDVWRPDTPEPLPVLLTRSPYGEKVITANLQPARLAAEGFAVVVQNCRGRFGSEGEWSYVHSDVQDGYDAVEWAGAQPWSNGRVGMFGHSYLGNTQWLAAQTRPPHLEVIAPEACAADYWEGTFGAGGAFRLALRVGWTATVIAEMAPSWGIEDTQLERVREVSLDLYATAHEGDPEALRAVRQKMADAVNEILRRRPLRDDPLWHGRATWLDEAFEHEARSDSHWLRANPTTYYSVIDLPALHVGGWYDIHLGASVRHYTQMRRQAPTARARAAQHLVIGPWDHWHPGESVVGDLDFGPAAAIDLTRQRADWFRRWLKDEPTPHQPPVRIFVMGRNAWRDEQEWPLARTRYTPWYLQEECGLSPEAPTGQGGGEHYTYDPRDPAPTVGGRLLGSGGEQPGPLDQRRIAERADILAYTSGELAEELEITGPVTMDLWAATDAADTDFTAILCDIHPDGTIINLCEGAVRARHTGPVMPLAENAAYHYTIDLAATSAVLFPGHRIGVRISSSSFPEWEPNPNTGHPLGVAGEADLRVAHQHILRDRLHPSRIVLPVIP